MCKKILFCTIGTISIAGFFLFFNIALASSLPEVPKIISRAEWGADETIKKWEPEYDQDENGYAKLKVERIVIHHTASRNLQPDPDGSGYYKAMVRAIYNFHVRSATWEDYNGQTIKGFGDLGYHYLIDPNGNIYQGRTGANGVVGAHVYGYNKETIGIALIGTYGATINGEYIDHNITAKAQDSLEKLIAWVAAGNDLNLDKLTEINGKLLPGLIGHKDLRSTQCPGKTLYNLIDAIRSHASIIQAHYKKYTYQVFGDSKIYIFENGVKKIFNSITDYLAKFSNYENLVKISKSQLDLFAEKPFIKWPDGTLIQFKNDFKIYLLDQGKKRHLDLTSIQFTKLNFDWGKIKSIVQDDFNLYPDGVAVKYGPDGSLIKGPDNKIYFIDKGKKRWITSQLLFNVLGYSWKKVKSINENEFATYLEGEPMRYPKGTLVQSSSPDVFYIENGELRKITSLTLFNKLGYSWNKLLKIDPGELNLYAWGAPMIYPDGTLLRASNSSSVYLIENNQRHEFISAQHFLNLKYKWSNVLVVSPEELNNHFLGNPVAHANGTLVRREDTPTVYVIKNGQPSAIPDAKTFVKLGYKWSRVLVIDGKEFDRIYPQLSIPISPVPQPSQPQSQPQPASIPNSTPNQQLLIRIGIFEVPNTGLTITANGAYDIYNSSNKLIVSKQVNQETFVDWSKDAWQKFVPKSNDVILEIKSMQSLNWNKTINYNRFRGNLEVRYSSKSDKVWVINELSFEDYIKGLAEALNTDLPEYRKSFVVAARSYAKFHLDNGGKRLGEIFHLNATASDQVYKGYNFEQIAPNLVQSATETQGIIMTFDGKPARAAYSSDSGGVTKSACSVWGGDFCSTDYGYLAGGVKDPEGTVHDQAKIAASHGVGMSCIGARQMAAQGKTYQEILQYYYLGVKIEKIY